MNLNFVDKNFAYCVEILRSKECITYTYGKSIDMIKFTNVDEESKNHKKLFFEDPIVYSHFDNQNDMESFLNEMRESPSLLGSRFRDVIALRNSTNKELTLEEKLDLLKNWHNKENM